MLNLISLIIGLVTFLFLVVTFIFPIVGALGAWLSLAAAVVGAGIGQLALSKSGRNFNIFVMLVALLRISIGGGLI
ncbi:hypothetical protein [Pacificimonas flava]|uniref:Uncharacterized protein n=1 Tax=Pacificimonas flava TaxID=1234595 RepID=M2U8Q5_9SPHN|nr:hypothetical protein [Pacificimonas flava]EMD84348.1 hypothetical protein C725_0278 [Pacificimonas flava]MBB5279777.1 uncharacterized protein YqfA (UPF0365 family) [Pacificimonas flava]